MASQSNNMNISTSSSGKVESFEQDKHNELVDALDQLVNVLQQDQDAASRPQDNFKPDDKTKPSANPKVVLEEFPELGTKLSKEQQRALNEIQQNTVSKIRDENSNIPVELDARTASFAVMADKEKVAASLVRTKACRMVTEPFLNPKEGEEPKFGVCTRANCSFAHSQEEIQPPPCGFDKTCRMIHGKVDRNTGKKIPNSNCKFHHSFETVEEWLKRSGQKPEPLPETNEFSRKPIPFTSKTPNNEPTNTSPDNLPIKNRKSRWDQKPVAPVKTTKNRTKKSSSESSSDSSSSSSDSEYDHKSQRSSDRIKRRTTPLKNNNEQVIRVPNQELAKMAIQMAFESGNYNIRVIVE